jgi:L-ascorbate metabolism protein UlaG (beta-lactamase superfamily)
MKLAKYRHACFTVEKDDQILVIDPGEFSQDFIAPEHVVVVVITHKHGDHFDHDQLASIIDKNPDALIIGPEEVTAEIEVFQTKAVRAGDTAVVGPFSLQFTGGKHAVIHSSIPIAENVGVIINELLYYPGDSLVLPGKPVDTLALPAAAPWMKIGEGIDFLITIKPRLAFPTHDAILSQEGKELCDAVFANANSIEYKRLDSPIEI